MLIPSRRAKAVVSMVMPRYGWHYSLASEGFHSGNLETHKQNWFGIGGIVYNLGSARQVQCMAFFALVWSGQGLKPEMGL